MGPIAAMLLHVLLSGRNILSRKCSLKHFQRSQGLVERHLVSRFVDSHETVQVTLSHLPVNNSVRGGDVDEACLLVARCVDFLRDHLSTKPVAVEVAKMRVSVIRTSRGGKSYASPKYITTCTPAFNNFCTAWIVPDSRSSSPVLPKLVPTVPEDSEKF